MSCIVNVSMTSSMKNDECKCKIYFFLTQNSYDGLKKMNFCPFETNHLKLLNVRDPGSVDITSISFVFFNAPLNSESSKDSIAKSQ